MLEHSMFSRIFVLLDDYLFCSVLMDFNFERVNFLFSSKKICVRLGRQI